MTMLPQDFRHAADLIRLTQLHALIGSLCLSIAASAAEVPMLAPSEELATFQLPPGYRLELVVGDPVIKEPVAIAFDGNGRMFVAEMRAFMQDLEGTGQRERNGRVSMHWSSKGDGVFDRHSVFVDGLVLPRMILPLDGALLVAETDSNDLHLYSDTDGDGVSDKKDLWFAGGPRGGNLEHQPSGLVWCLDNWIYASYNAYRLRWNGAGRAPLQEPTPPNGGQWGVAQDDHGKLWFTGGAERGPQNFQQPILYGGFNITGQTPHNFSEVWPLVGLADVEGGAMRFRAEDKTLNHFTSPCGSEIIRGDRLPAELRGDLLVCEPVGRLIRRAKVEVRDGVTHLRNPHERSEFIRSTDPNFRPVSVANAPDGTLYIVDMYRGVVQEAVAIKEGSYLRGVVQKHGLEKNIGRGRIWRLVHESAQPSAMPKMLDETPAQLVSHLAHPNGWWRDTAQKLLVLRNDSSVVPELKKMAQTNEEPRARLHALWTLEGLRALDAAFVLETLKDESAALRIGAIRASESIMPKEPGELQKAILALAADADPNVVIQVMMTAHRLAWPSHRERIESLVSQHRARGVQEIGRQLLSPPSAYLSDARFSEADRKFLSLGEVGYRSLCFACHGNEGRGTPAEGLPGGATLAPPLAGSPVVLGPPEQSILVLLHGLTGPVDGKTYVTQMVPMATNSDYWIASVLSYIRNSFGNQAPFITATTVARVRAETKHRTTPPTAKEVQAFAP
jgi:glucose/arabinose dehydrogenase/mono/diheme cytochrome c family protein